MNVFKFLLFLLFLSNISYAQEETKTAIIEIIGEEEYNRQMALSLDGFDQSAEGFRMHSGNYELICLLIPEYIEINKLNIYEAANLHWHLGQIHAFNDQIKAAIAEMEKSSPEGYPLFWQCYVDGSIAFLNHDKEKLIQALETLKKQENQMNLDVLEKLLHHFDKPYWEAYNSPPL